MDPPDGCRCSDAGASAAVLGSLTERACAAADGTPGVQLRVRGRQCVPLSYGSACAAEDSRPWCYVDRDACAAAPDQRVYRSEHFTAAEDGVDLFWSYTVCDGADAGDWGDVRPRTLGGATLVATTPQAYFPPYHYKRGPAGEVLSEPGAEYWNKSAPFEGAMIDYLDQLQVLAAGDFSVEWTFGSRGSKRAHPSSAYTASVQDVADGLIDFAVGPIWVTGERLRMSPYTMPLFYSPTVLIAPRPGVDSSLRAQTSKVLEPFKLGVWCMIVVIIAVTAALSMWFSGEGRRRVRHARRLSEERSERNVDGPPRSRWEDYAITARLGLDAYLRTGTYFFSAGVEQDDGASLPAKLLLFGFAAFTLVVISAYVADLAAFFTRNQYHYVGTMEEVTRRGWRICALPATKEELLVAWPDTRFVFSNSGNSYHGLLEDYDRGKCQGIIYGFANLDLKNKLCERGLVKTPSLALENPVAWPIRPDYAAGLSHWIYEAEKKHGLTVEGVREQYDARGEQPACDVIFAPAEDEADDYAQISLLNLSFPFILFTACALVACWIQLYAGHTRSGRGRRSTLVDHRFTGRTSTLGVEESYRDCDASSPCEDFETAADREKAAASQPKPAPSVRFVAQNRAVLDQWNGFEEDPMREEDKNDAGNDADDTEKSSVDRRGHSESTISGLLAESAEDANDSECERAKSRLLDELFRRYTAIERQKKT